jgi:hypothetical protein
MRINVFDTAAESDNLGDTIIMEAVWNVLAELFGDAEFITTPTHRRATIAELRAGGSAPVSIVGGTNILKSHMLVRGNWKVTPLDYLIWRNVILLGVGWQQYAGDADLATRLFFRTVMSKSGLHSVRDMDTYEKLRRVVPSVVYTGCPTMWQLDDVHCRRISQRKARNAIFAVTYYRSAPEQDRALFDLLKRKYDTVYFWPQQARDVPYAQEIGLSGCVPIDPDVAAYDRLLAEDDVDFVGARLHGGIRALQKGRRALIVPVDNRAIEIAKSTNLPIASRDNPALIEQWIDNPAPVRLTMPWDAIERWKNQFGRRVPVEGDIHPARMASR